MWIHLAKNRVKYKKVLVNVMKEIQISKKVVIFLISLAVINFSKT